MRKRGREPGRNLTCEPMRCVMELSKIIYQGPDGLSSRKLNPENAAIRKLEMGDR